MKILKSVVYELEQLICENCDADSSNCSYCSNREKIIEILEKNQIDTTE